MTALENKFRDRGYPQKNTADLKSKAASTNRNDLLVDKLKTGSNRTPFTTTFNKHHPPIQQIINKHWHILQTSKDIAPSFTNPPVVAYRRNKNLRDLLGQVHCSRDKKILPGKKSHTSKGCKACLSSTKNKCCKIIVSTKTFKSDTTNEELEILHNLNCKSRNTIYLGHCILCEKNQYIGKSEPPAHLRFNTHRHDVNGDNGCSFDKHFALPGHNFDKHARFTLIEQINSSGLSKLETRQLLENREDYWMKRLKTIHPQGQNDHLKLSLRQKIHTICE